MPIKILEKQNEEYEVEKHLEEKQHALNVELYQEMAYTSSDEDEEVNPLEDHFEEEEDNPAEESAKKKRQLKEKIEEAIAEQNAYASEMHDIINNEKNTMTYAEAVYGDEADIEAISSSAGKASDKVEKVAAIGAVSVATAYGVHYMDKEVAEALSSYSKMHPITIIDRLEYENIDVVDDDIQFTKEEEAALAELRALIQQQDEELYEFQNEVPEGMSEEEYAVYNRNRRFEKYGQMEEVKQLDDEYDYYVLPDGTVRALPELTEEEKDYLRQMEYKGGHKQREEDKEYT